MSSSSKTPTRKPRTHSGWSPERRARQSAMMRAAQIWTKSTGPKTKKGKARSSLNATKHGHRGREWRHFYALLARQRVYVRNVLAAHKINRLEAEKQKNATNELLKQDGNFIDIRKEKPLSNGMDSNTRDVLSAAYRENRLAALHIDYQDRFYERNPFLGGRYMAAAMRKLDVPNIWVGIQKHPRSRVTTVGEFNKSAGPHERLHESVQAECGETAFIKSLSSAFGETPAPLANYLDTLNKDVLLVGGVYGEACVATTIRDAISQHNYTVIVVADAVDLLFPEKPELYENILTAGRDRSWLKDRYHIAFSGEIVQTLVEEELRLPDPYACAARAAEIRL
jgi:nicotinamidase-related amidase